MRINQMYTTVDVHVAGEPLRIITDGLPEIKGKTQLERRAYCMEHLDDIRKVLMLEPRGHHGMYHYTACKRTCGLRRIVFAQ